MHLVPDLDDPDAPDGFTERILQARLADFWRSFEPSRKSAEYNMIVAEERYEKFCSEFLAALPSAFALHPNKEWDERLPMLPLQRQHFHFTIFDTLCHNFRPALLQDPGLVQALPRYKQVLLSSQRKALAVAALNVLKGIAALHAMMGGSHTRFSGIPFATFEAAVLLVYLCAHPDFPGEGGDSRPVAIKADPLAAGMLSVTHDECIRAVEDALGRLRMLAEVSNMAEVGARTLAKLMSKATWPLLVTQQVAEAPAQMAEAWSSASLLDYLASDPLMDFFSAAASDGSHPNWETLTTDLNGVSGV